MVNILYVKLLLYAEEIIGKYQRGVRWGRPIADQIFTVSQIPEKYMEQKTHVRRPFIDFQSAYDTMEKGGTE